jgi:hypothetical protein
MIVACSGDGDEAATSSGAGIEDGGWWRYHDGF